MNMAENCKAQKEKKLQKLFTFKKTQNTAQQFSIKLRFYAKRSTRYAAYK